MPCILIVMDTLSGSVERITFYNPENGYTVLRLRPEHQKGIHAIPKSSLSFDGLATVVGNLPELSPGEHLRLQGQWDNIPTWLAIQGRSLRTNPAGHRRRDPGLSRFGHDQRHRSEAGRAHRREVQGRDLRDHRANPGTPARSARHRHGPHRQDHAAWQEQKQVKEIMVFLHGHGVSTNLAVKIYKTYGDKSLETVQKNPYQLERDIYGVGFKTADRIAQALGLPVEHPSRIEAGIVFALNEMINDGHVYVPRELLAQTSHRAAGSLRGTDRPGPGTPGTG